MTYEPAEVIALVVLIAAAVVPALFVFNRRQDPFDPRVFFPLIYAYLTTSPCLFKIFISGEYHPGLKVDHLVPVLISCAVAVLGFVFGGSIAIGGTTSTMISGTVGRATMALKRNSSSRLVRGLAIWCATASVLAYGYYSNQLQLHDGEGKEYVLASADEETLRQYYFFAAATTAALMLAVIADAYASQHSFSLSIVILLAAQFVICTRSGEREFLLVDGVWCLANWHRLSRTQVLLFAVVLVGWVGIIPAIRSAGLGFGSQLQAVDQLRTQDWLYSVCHFSPNVHVFTNVVDEVPATESHWNGYSLFAAVASLVPGDYEFKQITPARWFREVYDMQRVAGFAFSQDAEAYLNFGWLGPPAWFAVWGYLLGVAYRRAARPSAQIFAVFIWWYAVATSLFGIRSDARGMIKMFVLGMLAAKTLCLFADIWSKYRSHFMIRSRCDTPRRVIHAHSAIIPLLSQRRPSALRRLP